MSYHPYALNPERYSAAAVANFTPEDWRQILHDLLRLGHRAEAEKVLAAHEREIQIAKDAIARVDAQAAAEAAENAGKVYGPQQERERLLRRIAAANDTIAKANVPWAPSFGPVDRVAPDPEILARAERDLADAKAALVKVEARIAEIEAGP